MVNGTRKKIYIKNKQMANDIRNTFADYFYTVGAVAWQNDK